MKKKLMHREIKRKYKVFQKVSKRLKIRTSREALRVVRTERCRIEKLNISMSRKDYYSWF